MFSEDKIIAKNTPDSCHCFSFFHTGDAVFEVLQEAQQCPDLVVVYI
jgi:hypothetical protein